jgi:hypothetical protein
LTNIVGSRLISPEGQVIFAVLSVEVAAILLIVNVRAQKVVIPTAVSLIRQPLVTESTGLHVESKFRYEGHVLVSLLHLPVMPGLRSLPEIRRRKGQNKTN